MEKFSTGNGGYAVVVQDSISTAGDRLTTFNVKYWLGIHAEFLRHRQLSRGVKSNRAIPTKNIRREVLQDPYVPVFFGANQAGMVAGQEVRFPKLASMLWRGSRYPAVAAHWLGEKLLNGHKEWLNRLLNPWQWVRETITATEYDNLYNLRIHDAAQKDIKIIVEAMYEAQKSSVPMVLSYGDLHVPYVTRERGISSDMVYIDNDGNYLKPEEALKCSAARCARSSYDNHDKSLSLYSGDIGLYTTLIEDDPKHASPVEHQGSPMEFPTCTDISDLEVSRGETHVDCRGNKWSGNYKGFTQIRQSLKNHTCFDYKGA